MVHSYLLILLTLLFILQTTDSSFLGFEFDSKSNERLTKGKDALDSIINNSKQNKCWEKTLESLSNGCKGLDDTTRSRLAVQLANCHLEKSGLKTYPCTSTMPISECTGPMSEMAFMTFTNFYISTDSICYYLQSEVFQSRTEETVNLLATSTVETLTTMKNLYVQAHHLSETIDESNLAQQKLMNNQNSMKLQMEQSMDYLDKITTTSEGLKNQIRETTIKQDEISVNQKKLSEEYQTTSLKSLDILTQIKDSASYIISNTLESLRNQGDLLNLQQKAIGNLNDIGDLTENFYSKQRELLESQDQIIKSHQIIITILDGINSLSNLILFEFIDLKSIFYYAFVSLLIYIVTSHKRTISSRFLIYVGLIITIFMEKLIMGGEWVVWIPSNILELFPTSLHIGDASVVHLRYHMVSRCRTIFTLYSIFVFALSAYYYRDYDVINHHILLDLVESNRKIVKLLKKSIPKKQRINKDIVVLDIDSDDDHSAEIIQ